MHFCKKIITEFSKKNASRKKNERNLSKQREYCNLMQQIAYKWKI